MNQEFVYKKVNNRLTIRLVKWYETGPLGCGKNSVPWIDISPYISFPNNIVDIRKEIEINSLEFPQLSGGVASIIPYHVNNNHILSYYLYNIEKYVPLNVRLTATTKWDIENWLFENVCDKIWSLSLAVRKNKTNFWYGKNSNQCEWDTDKFPLLKNWIESLDMFEEIGRVIIFKNNPGTAVSAHRDDLFAPHSNHFINFQLNNIRPAYIYNEITNEKIYINSRAYMFNEHDIHGVDAETTADFTVRVDGKFTGEFANQIGLHDGVVWSKDCKTGPSTNNLKFYEY
jgi:hypothetical protein